MDIAKRRAELLKRTPEQLANGLIIHGVQGNVAFAETEDDADRLIESLTDAGPGFRYWKVPA